MLTTLITALVALFIGTPPLYADNARVAAQSDGQRQVLVEPKSDTTRESLIKANGN